MVTNGSSTGLPLVRRIAPRNILSFGPDTPALELSALNVLIGPNGAGKSNLIELLALMRATPVAPQATSNADVRGVVRRGGGVVEWVWKGAREEPASVELVVGNPKGKQPLRHLFAFRADVQGFRLHDERVENENPYPNQGKPCFYYRFQDGHPVVNAAGRDKRKLARETVNLDLSILAQRRDPELYPEITYLVDTYEKWRIYREWSFGRNTVFREPQKADSRNDRLEEDFSNLGLFLSHLRKTQKAKKDLVQSLADLYDGLSDFDPIVEGGSVQVFFSEGDFSIPATRLSDGTLRYLCLLAILCDPSPPPLVCIEEPELGLHPDILPKLADLLVAASGRTQIVVTTHSDILVDAMTERPEAVVVCEKRAGRTEMRRLDRQELSKWLDKYRLGQLWTKGQLGGTRW
ncbi:MAG: AAA family ATPase [Deltaproteobacteria bacterium]|nr:AAA family ATPase [Deltaproteobacteria bacterium]